eukprot:6672825-Pyramimonas_sp.AAC.1
MHWRARQAFDNKQGIYRTPAAPNGFATGRRARRRAPNVHPQNGGTFFFVVLLSGRSRNLHRLSSV